MKYRTCYEAYQEGVVSRRAHPLRFGLYKLIESKDRIKHTGAEIIRISEVVSKRRHPASLMHCTSEDKASWLREAPFNVAHWMGYEIIPGIRALEFDGVNRSQAETAAQVLESLMNQHLMQWERLRNCYAHKIVIEYKQMRSGHSNALFIVNDAIFLINHSVKFLPSNIQRQIEM